MTIAGNVFLQSTFDVVAAEYYDPVRHPTCANFRCASQILLSKWLSNFKEIREVCEVGAGKSVVAELLLKKQPRLDNLILVDESAAMLSYSQHFASRGARLQVTRAEHLPSDSNTIDILISCLGDPYNYPVFWKEVQRVLPATGAVFFTSPSYEWAVAYRGRCDNHLPQFAEFELTGEDRVMLPSYILPEDQQIAMMRECGLTVTETSAVCLRDLEGQSISPKLLNVDGLEAAVVTGYVAYKCRIA
jgi:ubiquinone/menaquinone biosynthesis C-methylase UbiE